MRKISLFFVLVFITLANAQAIVCTFTEDEGSRAQKTTEVMLESDNHHGMTHFNLDLIRGFIAASNGYLVVNVILKENGQVFSMNTLMNDHTTLGGMVVTPDLRLIRISCQ